MNSDFAMFSGLSLGQFYVAMCKTKARALRENLVNHPRLADIADRAGVARTTALNFYRKDEFSVNDFYCVLSLAGMLGIEPGWFLLDEGDIPQHIVLPKEALDEIAATRIKFARRLDRPELVSGKSQDETPGASLDHVVRLLRAGQDKVEGEGDKFQISEAIKSLEKAQSRLAGKVL